VAKPEKDGTKQLINLQLLLIALVAIGLRFWNLENMPFSYDEFSALFRTRFSDFYTLIESGVKPDTHPLGVQSFLWIMIDFFGENSYILKIPFVLAGIASVGLTYDISRQCFGRGSALLSAAFIAVVQISVIQSQIIRPYSPGLFFSLLAFWSWLNFNTKENRWWLLLFSISLALSAYIHYFSLLQSTLIFAVTLFLSKREDLKFVISAGIGAVALFLPGIGITLHQLGHGGIGTILGAPDLDFFVQYFAYLSHYSLPFALVILAVVLLSIYGGYKNRNFNSKTIAFIILAFLPGIIGSLYSILVNPVLMERSLYFSLPFLVILVFSGVPEKWNKLVLAGVLSILSLGTYSLIVERQNIKMTQVSGYQEVLKLSKEWNSNSELNSAILISSKIDIIDYEVQNLQLETGPIIVLDEFTQDTAYMRALRDESLDQVLLGRTMQYYAPSPSFEAYAYAYGYSLHEQDNWFNSDFRIFRKGEQDLSIYNSVFPSDSSTWNYQAEELRNGKITLPLGQEWGPSWEMPLTEIVQHPNNELAAFIEFESENLGKGVELVSMIQRGEEVIHYSSVQADELHYPMLSIGLKLADLNKNTSDLTWKVFVWNKEKAELTICKMGVMVFPGNPFQYAWYQKIE